LVCLLWPGCKREEPTVPATQPAPAPQASAPSLPAEFLTPSQDDMDDPTSPPYLPKSNVVGTWLKHRAVRVAMPGQLAQLFAERAAQLEPFRIKQAASCVYRRIVNEEAELAYVELIETYTPDDAFGVLSIQCTASETLPLGQLTRVDTTAGYHLHGWKGSFYVHVYGASEAEPTFRQSLNDLLARIVFEMPAASPPALLQALPQPNAIPAKQWLVRSTVSLAAPGAAEVPVPDAVRVNQVLQLDKDTPLVIAAYDQPGLPGPNYVWFVRYAAPDQARQAYDRYRAAIEQAAVDSSLANTLLAAPQGSFLLGSWTADRESLMHVLPLLRARLAL